MLPIPGAAGSKTGVGGCSFAGIAGWNLGGGGGHGCLL
jgi:hypothetical protein